MTGVAPEVLGPTRIVLGDANVLYSRVLRDYLVYAADEGVISIRWSQAILNEVVKHLQANNSTFDDEQAELPEAMASVGIELLTADALLARLVTMYPSRMLDAHRTTVGEPDRANG